MKYFFIAILLFSYTASFAQDTDSLPLYKKFPDVPPFMLTTLPDSGIFKKDDLEKKKYTLIMVFSPDCDHCQHATEDLLANINSFKKVQIIMATPLEYRLIIPFYQKYQLANQKNIVVGRDPTYFLGNFYGVRNFPSMYLYDKKGKFVRFIEGTIPFATIAGYIK